MTQKRQKRSDELIDEILAESGLTPEAILGESGVMAMLKKRLIVVPRRDNRDESGAIDFTIIAGNLERGPVGM